MRDVRMTDCENGRAHGESVRNFAALSKALALILVWVMGMASTVYLLGQGLLLSVFSIGFINYSEPHFAWWKVADVALDTLPLLCFAAIGFVGLKFWPHERRRLWGLSAMLIQTAMAIVTYARPEGLLAFKSWLSRLS
jgi:hypothetical protein